MITLLIISNIILVLILVNGGVEILERDWDNGGFGFWDVMILIVTTVIGISDLIIIIYACLKYLP